MALEDLISQYGPSNKKGEKGTGVSVDTLANEATKGLEDLKSNYGTTEKTGTKPTGPDPMGNRPAERSYE